MNQNIAIVESVAFLGGIDPASQAAGTYLTGAIDGKLHRRLLFMINAGALGGATLTFTALSSATAAGTYTPIAGLVAAPVIAVNGNKVLFELRPEQVQSLGGFEFVKGQVVVAGGTAVFAVEVWASNGRYLPASDYNAAAIQAVVLN